MKLIIGLGNPGNEYEKTRHNIGYMVIDEYLKSLDTTYTWQKKFNSLYTTIIVKDEKVILVKPETYMNLSGEAVQKFIHFYKIPLNDLLVIQDDLDLPLSKYRLKINSNSGGHNGIKNIIDNLGTNAFLRLKIGISKNNLIDTKDYVLGHFNSEELELLKKTYPIVNNLLNDFIKGTNPDILMNKYN